MKIKNLVLEQVHLKHILVLIFSWLVTRILVSFIFDFSESYTGGDGVYYFEVARNILASGTHIDDSGKLFVRAPLYSFFVASVLFIKDSQPLFFVIQIIGSIFLAGLGFLFILKSDTQNEYEQHVIKTNAFLQGLLIALLNPKILIWFTAIFSQFIRVEANNLEKTILVSTAAIIDAIWYSIVSILVTGYGFKSFIEKKKSIIQKFMGILLIIISIGLLLKLINF